MGTPHRLSLIALSCQIQFCATRHHPDVRLPLLTVSILSFVDLVAHEQIKNPAYIAVSRVWKILWFFCYLLTSGLSKFGSGACPLYDVNRLRLNTQPWLNRL